MILIKFLSHSLSFFLGIKFLCVIELVSKSSKYNFSFIKVSLFKIFFIGDEEEIKKILGNFLYMIFLELNQNPKILPFFEIFVSIFGPLIDMMVSSSASSIPNIISSFFSFNFIYFFSFENQ